MGLRVRHGAVLMVLGQYENSVGEYRLALELARQLGDRRLETDILIHLGEVENFYHRPERALEHLEQALTIARESGNRAGQTICLASTVLTRACIGQLSAIVPQLEEALRLAPDVGDARQQARTLASCGTVLQWRGDFDRALPHLHRAATLAEDSRWIYLGHAAFGIGHVKFSRAAYEEALAWDATPWKMVSPSRSSRAMHTTICSGAAGGTSFIQRVARGYSARRSGSAASAR